MACTIPAFVGRTCVKYRMELYPDFLNSRRTGKSWVLKFRQTLFFPRRVFPETVQSVLRWWSFVSALVIRVDRPWWPGMLPVVCSTREICCSTKMIYRSILVHVPRFDSSTIFFCPHWNLLRQIQVGPGIITHRRDWNLINYRLYPDAKTQHLRLRVHFDFISSL